jgi:serine/threonine protein kinase
MTGGNLQSRLESHPPELALAGRWIQKLADALDYAHHHQVIHGDLKPSCIVFDGDGTPYLTDFALARGGDAPTRSVLGTPDYLAPEQWDGESPTAATDQYSLAVLAYIMITGTRPHEGQSDPAVRARNFRRGPPLAHEEALVYGRKAISQRVSRVLAQAMSVRSADRYPSVGEFSAALAEAIANPDRRSAEPHIFMSYHRESSAGWANLLAQSLKEKYGYSVFIDTQAQDGAPQIPERLRTEIAQCDVFVCMLAPATLTSRWVREEIDVAFQFHKPMVPVFHEDFRPKDQTEGGESGVKSLLNFAAVHLLDRKNIHVEHTITELAERVRKALP